MQGKPQRPVSNPERLPLAVRLVLWLVLVLVPQQPKEEHFDLRAERPRQGDRL